jgi:hypothetical protein
LALGFATQIRVHDGFQVWDGICNRHQLLRFLVELHGMPESKAHQLLDPADKQNVPKAIALLQAICDLRQFPQHPSVQADLHRFHFLGEVISSFLSPFINIVEQAYSIFYTTTQYCYLTCYMYRRRGVVVFEACCVVSE